MKSTSKNLSDTKVEIKVVLDSEDLERAQTQAVARLAKEVKLAGFRKGKVPVNIAIKHLDPNDINTHTLDIAVRNSVPAAFDAAKKVAIMIPEVSVTKFVPGESAEYIAKADVLPEIKLGDYKKLKAKRQPAKVAEKDIQDVLDGIMDGYSEKVATKKKAALGDEVIIDFTGKKDGEPFDGGSAKSHTLRLGSGQFIPGFEEGIVGHEPGDKFDLPLTFPKDYHAEQLAGAKVVFEVLLKQVNEMKKPKLDDELAKKCGFKTLAELKADIKKNLENQGNYRAEEKFKDDLVAELVKNSKVAAPEAMVNDQIRFIEDDISRNAAAQGLTFDDYLKQTGQTKEEWQKQAHQIGEDRVKASLVLQVLARDEGIAVEDEVVDAKIAELRDVYQKSPEALANLKDPRVRQDIKNRLTIEKTLEFLVRENTPKQK